MTGSWSARLSNACQVTGVPRKIRTIAGKPRPRGQSPHLPAIASALQIGRRYQFDELHAVAVSTLALQLFDATHALHNLGLEHRFLLEVAALLHDIGGFIAVAGHHKHTQYILQLTPVVGLSSEQMAIVANVARYHRGSMPKAEHEAFQVLPSKDRLIVSQLAALLRVADAMDREHASKVHGFRLDFTTSKVTLTLEGEGDLSPEWGALIKKSKMFEKVFNVRLAVS